MQDPAFVADMEAARRDVSAETGVDGGAPLAGGVEDTARHADQAADVHAGEREEGEAMLPAGDDSQSLIEDVQAGIVGAARAGAMAATGTGGAEGGEDGGGDGVRDGVGRSRRSKEGGGVGAAALDLAAVLHTKGAVMSSIRLTPGSHRIALLTGCAFAAALALSTTPVMAGCNSGNVGQSDLLASANCQANASGSSATAVGVSSIATSTGSTALGRAAQGFGDWQHRYRFRALRNRALRDGNRL